MAVLACLFLLLAFTAQSDGASYCICKDGVGEQALQKALDYACGAGADCNPISQNGVCFQPNTVKDHCNYAVNSYFQKKGQGQGTCDFAGAAAVSSTAPATASTSCVYPTSNTGTTPSTTPSTTPTPPTAPSTTPPATPSTTPTTTPSTTPTTPSTNPTTPSTTPTTTPTTTPSSTPVIGTTPGLGPTGSGITDSSNGLSLYATRTNNLFISIIFGFWFSVLAFQWWG